MIPYGKQSIDQSDVDAVTSVLRSDWLTQGPKVEEFENALAKYCGAKFAVVTSNGTTALHAAFAAAGVSAGDEVISSPMTFCATTNAALYLGAKPVFVDVDPKTGNINTSLIESKITGKTKVIAPIDYTGRPANLSEILKIAKKNNLIVVEDACQALGASYQAKKIGTISDLTCFSFHPVKTITTGEGGAVLTNNENYYKFLKKYISHGITKTDFIEPAHGPWYLEMQVLGNNYRLTDIQCALGISQLKKTDLFVSKRRELVDKYRNGLKDNSEIILPPPEILGEESAWHLFVIQLKSNLVSKKTNIIEFLRSAGIVTQVHHLPVYYHPYYKKIGFKKGLCPVAERWYDSSLTLPLYPTLTQQDQAKVIDTLKLALDKFNNNNDDYEE